VDPVIAPSVAIYRVNDRLFGKGLDGLSRPQLLESPSEAANPILWIAGHVANTRFGICAMLGRKLHRPWGDIFNRFATLPDADAYPELPVIRAAWTEVSAALTARFEDLTDADLSAPAPRPFPTPDKSVRGMIAFLAYHEGYHLGQISYLRKWLGLPGLMDD
jgi:uncharacterized damage-inducible protein DinB